MLLRWLGRRGLAALCALLLVATGCARFDNNQSQPFTTQPERQPPQTSKPPPPPPLPSNPFPKQCPAPGVMQGCLESTSGLIMGPDSKSALVAERVTGAVSCRPGYGLFGRPRHARVRGVADATSRIWPPKRRANPRFAGD